MYICSLLSCFAVSALQQDQSAHMHRLVLLCSLRLTARPICAYAQARLALQSPPNSKTTVYPCTGSSCFAVSAAQQDQYVNMQRLVLLCSPYSKGRPVCTHVQARLALQSRPHSKTSLYRCTGSSCFAVFTAHQNRSVQMYRLVLLCSLHRTAKPVCTYAQPRLALQSPPYSKTRLCRYADSSCFAVSATLSLNSVKESPSIVIYAPGICLCKLSTISIGQNEV